MLSEQGYGCEEQGIRLAKWIEPRREGWRVRASNVTEDIVTCPDQINHKVAMQVFELIAASDAEFSADSKYISIFTVAQNLLLSIDIQMHADVDY